MLAEAVRNTQPGRESKRLAKAGKIAAGMARSDQASGVTAPVR